MRDDVGDRAGLCPRAHLARGKGELREARAHPAGEELEHRHEYPLDEHQPHLRALDQPQPPEEVGRVAGHEDRARRGRHRLRASRAAVGAGGHAAADATRAHERVKRIERSAGQRGRRHGGRPGSPLAIGCGGEIEGRSRVLSFDS